jgi:hypothetical protein
MAFFYLAGLADFLARIEISDLDTDAATIARDHHVSAALVGMSLGVRVFVLVNDQAKPLHQQRDTGLL